jgi:hypothetical protein
MQVVVKLREKNNYVNIFCRRDLRSTGILRSVFPIFKGLWLMTLEDWPKSLFRNVGKELPLHAA